MAAACGSAGAILGYRGNEAGAADWFAFSESIAPSTGGQLGGLHMMRADVDLHHGRVDEAAARLAAPAGDHHLVAVAVCGHARRSHGPSGRG